MSNSIKTTNYRDIADEEIELQHSLKNHSTYVWRRTGTGFRIQDLREPHFENVLKVIEKEYIPKDLIMKSVKLNCDKKSCKWFLDRTLFHLRNMSSLIAFDESISPTGDQENRDTGEEIDKIAGIFILRVIRILDYGRVISQTKLTNGDALKKCVRLRSCLTRKVDIYAKYECDVMMRCYDLCILSKYKHLGLGRGMMECAMELARSRGVQIVMGVFNTYYEQKLAIDIGLSVCHTIKYSEWKNSRQQPIFNNLGVENDSCALMVGEVPKPLPYPKKIDTAIPLGKKKSKKKGGKKKSKKKK